jgi:HEAT repeat protein
MAHNGFRGVRVRTWITSLSLLTGVAAFGSTALAGDLKTMDEAVAAQAAMEKLVREHVKDKVLEALKSDTADIMKARVGLAPALVDKYDALLGVIIKGTTDDGVQKVVIKAIGDSKSPGLFRFIQPFLVQPNKTEIPPLLEDTIEATGKLAADEGINQLITIVKDSKNYPLAAKAIKALGSYGQSKTRRNNILREVLNTVQKDQPSVGLRYKNDDGQGPYATAKTKTGDETKARYEALSGPMVEALNRMTTQKCGSPDDWFSLWDKYKGSPGDLFPKG